MTNKQEIIDWMKTNFTSSAPASYIISELEKLDMDAEISDDEIETESKRYGVHGVLFSDGAKWYKEQLKSK